MSSRRARCLVAFASVFAITGQASAQKKDEGQPRGVITLAEVTITGRIQKPIAAVDVNRLEAKLTLAELKQPFLDRIEKAISADPF